MGKARQLSDEEAHVLDHLVDHLMTTGALVIHEKDETAALAGRALDFIGDVTVARDYMLTKMARIKGKPYETYDDKVGETPIRPRLPFDADYDIVAEDAEVLKVYLEAATPRRDNTEERDPFAVQGVEDEGKFQQRNRLRGAINWRNTRV
jgi:hypothetical protein